MKSMMQNRLNRSMILVSTVLLMGMTQASSANANKDAPCPASEFPASERVTQHH
jgi:hypothetical protein